MSRVQPPSGEPVLATPRRSMSASRKRRIHERANGMCEEPTCGKVLPVTGPESQYDHVICLELGGADDFGNLQLLCFSCHAIKTAGDLATIGKNRRLRAREDGTRRPRKQINSPGFNKNLRKKLNGQVERRLASDGASLKITQDQQP